MKFILALVLVFFYIGFSDVTYGQLLGIPLDCPVGWKKNFRTNMCYWFRNNDFVPQYKAGQQCGNRGGHLVTINNVEENEFITSNYKINPNNTEQSEYAWTGLFEIREDKWAWEEDRSDVTWFNWANTDPPQPDDYKAEDYGVIQAGTGEWYDMRANYEYGYICEKEIPPPPPTTKAPPTNPPTPSVAP